MGDKPDAGEKDFLQKPPYQAADPAAFDRKLQGGCHCGRVKYWLSREQPLNAKFCHCRGCQVMHGKCVNPICLPEANLSGDNQVHRSSGLLSSTKKI